MAVPIVVDGYNLLHELDLHSNPVGPEAREALVKRLVRYGLERGREILLVFDGVSGGGRRETQQIRGPLTIIFTRFGELADDWIRRWVRSRPEAVVVTSDRAVAVSVRRLGATVLGAGEFAERLGGAQRVEAETDGSRDDEEAPPHGRGASRRLPRSERRKRAWLRDL